MPVLVHENSTAQEVLRQIANNKHLINENELNEYALFIKLENNEQAGFRDPARETREFKEVKELKERMLSSHECPLKIKKKVLTDTKFRFVAKKCFVTIAPIEDNVLGEKNLADDMIREGTLKKLSKSGWVDRYFILDSKCIYYGKDKKQIAKAFTRIDLETVSIQEASDKGKYCFQLIIAQHNKYVLKGNNTQNKEKWMQSISNQCSIVRENREFENINRKIRNEENKRAQSDERLVIDCQNLEKLSKYDEGVKLLINLEKDESTRKCLENILDYKLCNSKTLSKAEGKIYLALMDPVETHGKSEFWDLPQVQDLIRVNVQKLAKFKEKVAKNEINIKNFNLYIELFKGFIDSYSEYKSNEIRVQVDLAGMALDQIVELPIFRWKSKLKSIPGNNKIF